MKTQRVRVCHAEKYMRLQWTNEDFFTQTLIDSEHSNPVYPEGGKQVQAPAMLKTAHRFTRLFLSTLVWDH